MLGLVLAALIGLSLGMLGGGGSILTVPIFVYLLDFSAKPAIAMSLLVVGVTAAVGTLSHWRSGNVEVRPALLFGAAAMAGAFAGARLAAHISGGLQLLLLGLVMLAAAGSMFRRPSNSADTGLASAGSRRASLPVLGLVGLGVGVLTGVVGVGGGFLIVPALVVLTGLPMKHAVGTSLLVIAMNAAAGFAGYLGQVSIPWGFVGSFTAVAVTGILAGSYLIRLVSADALRRAFAVFLVIVGGLVLYQNRLVVLNPAASP